MEEIVEYNNIVLIMCILIVARGASVYTEHHLGAGSVLS